MEVLLRATWDQKSEALVSREERYPCSAMPALTAIAPCKLPHSHTLFCQRAPGTCLPPVSPLVYWHVANLWSACNFGVPAFFADLCLAFAHSCSTPLSSSIGKGQWRVQVVKFLYLVLSIASPAPSCLLNFIHFMLLSSGFIPVPSPLLKLLHLSLESLPTQRCSGDSHRRSFQHSYENDMNIYIRTWKAKQKNATLSLFPTVKKWFLPWK